MRKTITEGAQFKSGRWTIRAARSRAGNLCFDVESPNGLFSDRSIQYTDGRVAWDYPERIPQSVKARVRRLYDTSALASA
jgi:hypothetical protein